jgi:hypothetical protein
MRLGTPALEEGERLAAVRGYGKRGTVDLGLRRINDFFMNSMVGTRVLRLCGAAPRHTLRHR